MKKIALENLLAVVLLVSLLGLGCAQQDADRPSTCPVTGTVTHNGQTVDGATVAFQLADGSQSAIGVTDTGGKYTLTTFESGDGAVPGQYQVKIFKYNVQTASVADENSADYVAPTEGEEEVVENQLPAIYADPTTSGFTATVSEGGKNTFDFLLEG